MLYSSTRESSQNVTSAKAIVKGISDEGGLFVPQSFPEISMNDLISLKDKPYIDRAIFVLSKFLTDFTADELSHCVNGAYAKEKFSSDNVAELFSLKDGRYMLELWHGPTCAFKDMALQLLPYLLTTSAKKELSNKEIAILVATSGDTGKAALEGFKDVDGTEIMVFYPESGVSNMQKRQMITQQGENVGVCAIKGNFDDAQTGVKKIFTDKELSKKLGENDIVFSSANSINWGRLVPQIVYYFSAYCDLLKKGEINPSDEINVVVPTGNFGNILSAYYAKKMGLPIKKFICASNANNVLTDFIKTGTYDRNREFFPTISPSMDILISSNLERLLYDLCRNDDTVIKDLYENLSKDGKFTVSDEIKQKLQDEFYGGFCDDAGTKKMIEATFKNENYLCDTHTAVALSVYEDYKKETGDTTKTVIASTANPYKFPESVLQALSVDENLDEFQQAEKLSEITKVAAPSQLLNLKDAKVRFEETIEKSQMAEYVLKALGVC